MNGNGNDENGSTDQQTTISLANTGTQGLISEDGHTGGNVVFSPGVWVVTEERENPLFTAQEQASEGFTRLAEAGQTAALVSEMEDTEGVRAVGTVGDGPITPESSGTFTVDASEQGYVSLAAMLVPSNDMALATAAPLPLRVQQGEQDRRLVASDGLLTDFLVLIDAGTEPNAAHGEGEDQAPAQSDPLQGDEEGQPIRQVSRINDGITSPEVADVAELTFE